MFFKLFYIQFNFHCFEFQKKANHNETIQIKIKRNKENLLEDPTAFLGMCAHQLLKLKMKNRCYHCCSDFFFGILFLHTNYTI